MKIGVQYEKNAELARKGFDFGFAAVFCFSVFLSVLDTTFDVFLFFRTAKRYPLLFALAFLGA